MRAGLESEAARTTYEAAREHFDAAPLRFWERYGTRTITRVGPRPGARVLDVCSGSGASAIAAAQAVRPLGSVLAVDLSSSLLALARAKAEERGLTNIDFRVDDMTALAFPEESFDAIVVVFGIFFAPDMNEQVRLLHRMLRPGGTLAITTWGGRLFEPLYSRFLSSVRARRSSRDGDEYRPWDRVSTVDDVASLMRAASFRELNVDLERDDERIDRAEDWWTIIQGTGLRWFVDRLDASSADIVKNECLEHARYVRSIETNVIYALARK